MNKIIGTKESYIPALPPLTRCNQRSKLIHLWRRASAHPFQCHSGLTSSVVDGSNSSTSRGTHRLYVRLNTLHFLLTHLNALDKSLAFFDCPLGPSHHFSAARSATGSAITHVAEVAAFRLIFLDSRTSFYDGRLYVNVVATSRILGALQTLKEDLVFLLDIVVDKAQPLLVKQVMRASFEAFLMVLLAGGKERAFFRADHGVIAEDFKRLKSVFCTTCEGLVPEVVVEREAEVVEGILELMGQSTEQLIEDFSIVAYEASGIAGMAEEKAGPMAMPATTGRWNRADPDTVFRVLCHRDDAIASDFLKTKFQLPKRWC